jgi:predicted acylesterase/phospholipase RssA
MEREHSGFVLSGGGAYAAYEVGVLRALVTGASPATGYQAVDAGIISGTSGGAINAAVIACARWSDARSVVDHLEQIWLSRISEQREDCDSNVLRLRANPLNFLNPQCLRRVPDFYVSVAADLAYLVAQSIARGQGIVRSSGPLRQRVIEAFDLGTLVTGHPLRRLLTETVDFRAIRASPRALRIAATNWRTGELRVFKNSDMTDESGVEVLLASSAIPGLLPSVEIGDEPFVDGGVVMNTPLKPAIEAGASDLHVVYMDPDVIRVPLPRQRNTLNTLYRMVVISFGLTVSRDIRTAAAINLRVRRDQDSANKTALTGEPRGKRYRPLTIHRYHPREDLGGTFRWLDFNRDHVAGLIERGFEDALAHDCERNRCVIPGRERDLVNADTAPWARRDA